MMSQNSENNGSKFFLNKDSANTSRNTSAVHNPNSKGDSAGKRSQTNGRSTERPIMDAKYEVGGDEVRHSKESA
jgi:hypothetical protein